VTILNEHLRCQQMQKEAKEFTAQDYLNKIKDSVQIKANVETKFIQNEKDNDTTITVNDLLKKKEDCSLLERL